MPESDWISAIEALALVAAATDKYSAKRAICSRAYDGLIKARAIRLMAGAKVRDNASIPAQFWWARGEAALEQNWQTGDFETWIDHRLHIRAYGISFDRVGIEALVGPSSLKPKAPAETPTNPGGRPRAAWWDDLWIEVCRQLWAGDLQPKRQSDIESAMMAWVTAQGHSPSDSTLRERARKLWVALSKDSEN